MSERFKEGDDQTRGVVSGIFSDLHQERASESQLENMQRVLTTSCKKIIEEKGEWQPPDLRYPEYIRGTVNDVSISIDGLEYALALFEIVNTQRARSVTNDEPIAITDRYHISLREGHSYTPLFTIPAWSGQMTGWRGQRLNLAEAKMASAVLDYIDNNLQKATEPPAPNAY